MKQLRFLTIVIVIALMFSCNKEEKQGTGVGDVILISKIEGGQIVYGISINAYSYNSFQSVKAVSSLDSENTYTLKSYKGLKGHFYYEMLESDFAAAQPKAATYNFSAVFENGITQTFQNELTDKVLPIPVFEQCEYVAGNVNLLKLKWILNKDAANYTVRIMDGSNLIFEMLIKQNNVNSVNVSAQDITRANNVVPVSGKAYKIQLLAFLGEPNISNAFNIQAISIAESSIVWRN